ncbi:MAG TPA: hypothetical protein VEQ10_18960, partial [Vicinamibacteria bacterium]|nr:hypothetical protein [Vicinamibacteria bacterium]
MADRVIPARHPWARLPLLGAVVSLAGLVLLALAARAGASALLTAWLIAYVFYLTLALGCLYFCLIHTAMSGSWGVVVRRLAETGAATLPVFLLLFVPLALGLSRLYPWAATDALADPLLRWKRPYLNPEFFLLRSAVYLLVWSAVAAWFLRLSRTQDAQPDPLAAARLRRWSGPLLIPV